MATKVKKNAQPQEPINKGVPLSKSHRFMAEEVLSPNTSTTDLTRLNMFLSHVSQAQTLNNPEFPRLFTGFENQFGKYSTSAYSRFPDKEGFVLYRVIPKNDYNVFYVFTNEETKEVFVHKFSSSTKLTESYGYLNVNRIQNMTEGEKIKPERLLSRSVSFDRFMNTMYGVNLNVVYYPWKAMTYEDSVVIDEETANKRFATTHVHEVEITCNTNDILLNLYGDDYDYQCFPNVGEEIVNKILAARRRLSFQSILFDFSKQNMLQVNNDTDDVFYSTGKVTDIDIYCNSNMDDLDDRDYYKQISTIIASNKAYYTEIVETLKPLKDEGYKFLDDANHYLHRATEMISGKKFRNESSDFDNLVIKIKIEERLPLHVGDKITGRYGNKGVVGMIVADKKELPYLDDGTQAQIACNIFGVIGRINLTQLIEQELNFIGDQYLKHTLAKEDDLHKRTEMYIDFLAQVNKEQATTTKNALKKLDDQELATFWSETMLSGIFFQLKPFFTDGFNCFKLYEVYKYANVKPRQAYINKDGKKIKIITPLVIGKEYFMRLKHDAKGKFSARSGGFLNLSNIPSKNNRNYKESRSLYPKTAVRLGYMELANLTLLQNNAEAARFISTYSSNHHDREKIAMTLLGVMMDGESAPPDVFDIPKIEKSNKTNLNKSMLDAFLYELGWKLVNDDDDNATKDQQD